MVVDVVDECQTGARRSRKMNADSVRQSDLSTHSNRKQPRGRSSYYSILLLSHLLMSSTTAFQTRRRHVHLFPALRESTTRLMVLTTPESIIEQASTQSLLDDLIDESVRTSARRPVMFQFDPSSGWIWKRWKGTIFSETWDSCVSMMVYASAIFFLCKSFPFVKGWLSGFNILWGQLLSVTTFTLTFFVNQSYALWRKCYELSRRLQGRLHDLDMTLAAHAVRKPPASPNEPSTYTVASRQVLELVSRYVRLFNLLTYASFTRSHRPILTPRGMRRLVERGLMTSQEREVLVDAEIPATQRHNAVLLWIIRTFVEAREAELILGGPGFEEQFMEKIHVVRSQYGAIGDELQGRMPLAYAHIVQVLVDMILWMYPFMAYSSGMSGLLCVLGTGLLTISYQGLVDLAKQFLDPYDNESYGKGEDPLVVDTLIAETNAGSVRWMYGLEEYPVSAQRMKDGELSDYLLPIRGYSVEELEQMEEEKRQKERDLQEKREREEAEKRRAEEEEKRLREAAEAMIVARINGTLIDSAMISKPGCFVTSRETDMSQNPTGERIKLSLSTIGNVTDLLGMMAHTVSDDVIEDLIPEGTSSAVPHPAFFEEEIFEKDDGKERTLFGVVDAKLDYDDDEEEVFEVIEDWNADGETPYVHTFGPFDPYADLPWHDEVGPDGQEIRLSQMLADEVWEEELEAAQEKEARIRTYEEYTSKMKEIKDAAESELLETQEILMESPGTQSSAVPLKDDDDKVPVYDQTKLDGISQLWGLPPGELSDISGYEEPPITAGDENTFDGIAQLWGETIDSSSLPVAPNEVVDTVTGSFAGISQLWGEDIDDDLQQDAPSSTGTRRIKEHSGTRRVKDDTEQIFSPHEPVVVEDKEARMSQILADEVWEEELEATPMKPVTFEDYTKQVQEILDAEKEELLETEAIMNAPPAADTVDVPEKDDETGNVANVTSTVDDEDLSVLEMDEAIRKSSLPDDKVDSSNDGQMETPPAVEDESISDDTVSDEEHRSAGGETTPALEDDSDSPNGEPAS